MAVWPQHVEVLDNASEGEIGNGLELRVTHQNTRSRYNRADISIRIETFNSRFCPLHLDDFIRLEFMVNLPEEVIEAIARSQFAFSQGVPDGVITLRSPDLQGLDLSLTYPLETGSLAGSTSGGTWYRFELSGQITNFGSFLCSFPPGQTLTFTGVMPVGPAYTTAPPLARTFAVSLHAENQHQPGWRTLTAIHKGDFSITRPIARDAFPIDMTAGTIEQALNVKIISAIQGGGEWGDAEHFIAHYRYSLSLQFNLNRIIFDTDAIHIQIPGCHWLGGNAAETWARFVVDGVLQPADGMRVTVPSDPADSSSIYVSYQSGVFTDVLYSQTASISFQVAVGVMTCTESPSHVYVELVEQGSMAPVSEKIERGSLGLNLQPYTPNDNTRVSFSIPPMAMVNYPLHDSIDYFLRDVQSSSLACRMGSECTIRVTTEFAFVPFTRDDSLTIELGDIPANAIMVRSSEDACVPRAHHLFCSLHLDRGAFPIPIPLSVPVSPPFLRTECLYHVAQRQVRGARQQLRRRATHSAPRPSLPRGHCRGP